MKVHLAYEYEDENGKTHAPDTDVEVDYAEGQRLVTEGKGQAVEEPEPKAAAKKDS